MISDLLNASVRVCNATRRLATALCCWHRLALVALAQCILMAPLSWAGNVTIDGTRVTLSISDEFSTAEGFSGVMHKNENAAVVVNEVPGPYLELIDQYADEKLEKRGMKIVLRQHIEKDGLSGQLIHVSQEINQQAFERWILITGDTQESVMVAGYYPQKRAAKFSSLVETVLRGAFWDSSRSLDHFDGLGYRIDDVPSLRVVTRMNDNLVFTQTGQLPDQFYTDALLMLGMKAIPEDQELTTEYAEYQFKRISLLENPEIEVSRAQGLRGLRSVVVEGTGRHKHLGYTMAALQMIIATDEGFLIAQGFTTPEERENDFDIFYATLGSFRLETAAN